jgi:hypothetical protein
MEAELERGAAMVALVKDEPPEEPNPKTVGFIYDAVKDLPERQAHDWEAMETKAVQILTAASVVIGLASIGSQQQAQLLPSQAAVFIGGLVAYVAVLFAVAACLRTRDIRLVRQAEWLWAKRTFDVDLIQEELIKDIIAAYEENQTTIGLKAHFVNIALVALGVESVAVGAALIWSRLVH